MHFGRAAEACFVTQSTLSASLKELENRCGVPWSSAPSARRADPAGRGDRRARAAGCCEDARSWPCARAAGKPLSGALRLGVIPTIAPFLLPRILPAADDYPELKLYLREDLTARLVAQLDDGAARLLLLALPFDCRRVETRRCSTIRFGLACRRTIRWPGSASRGAAAGARDAAAAARRPLPARPRAGGLRLGAGATRARRSRRPACTRWCRWWTTGSASRCCRRWRSMPASSRQQRLMTRPLAGDAPGREIALVWRNGTMRRAEFELLGEEIRKLAKNG